VIAACLLTPVHAAAGQVDDPAALRQALEQLRTEFETLRQQYEARLAALEERLAALPGPPPDQAAQPGAIPPGGGRVFNPDMSVLANFEGVAGENARSDQPALGLSEIETALQAVVDPYARADFFLAATPEGLEIEEGYATFTSLPAGFLLKAGRMRAQFGKVNAMHTHVLPWSDVPIVSRNLVGGDEGFADAGLSLARLIPNNFMFLDAIGEVYAGSSEAFESSSRSELNYLGRLRGYRDLTEGTNLDLGVSYTRGPSVDVPDFAKQLAGLDVTFRYRPLRRAIYRQFVGRSEFVWSRQDVPAGPTVRAFGFFASGDYQFARRWFVGVRGDRSGRTLDGDARDSGVSVGLTFRPTEFSLVRGQYRHSRFAEGETANELLFQLNFAIGVHAAHPF
jgi:hypothetical protein